MNDRDALIERVKAACDKEASFGFDPADTWPDVSLPDLLALISLASPDEGWISCPSGVFEIQDGQKFDVLWEGGIKGSKIIAWRFASPSPAQTSHHEAGEWVHRVEGWEQDAGGEWVNRGEGWEWISTSPARTDAQMVRRLNEHLGNVEPLSTSPAQWPEDVVAKVMEICERFPPKQVGVGGFSDTYQTPVAIGHLRALRAAVLATLPPPEDERVKGLVAALEAIANSDGMTVSTTTSTRQWAHASVHVFARSALASYRGGA